MGSIVAEEEEEGVVFITVDEQDGVVGRDLRVVTYVSIVLVLADGDKRVAVQAIVGIIIGCVAVDGGDGPSIELVEASVVGCRLRVVAVEMPFVHQTSAIASGRDDGGDGGVLRQEVSASHNGGVAIGINLQTRETTGIALVVTYAGVAAVQTRHQ